MSSEERVKEEIHLFLKETARIFDLVKKYSILIEEKLHFLTMEVRSGLLSEISRSN